MCASQLLRSGLQRNILRFEENPSIDFRECSLDPLDELLVLQTDFVDQLCVDHDALL